MSTTTEEQVVTNADALTALHESQDLLYGIKEYADTLIMQGLEYRHVVILHALADAAIKKNAFGNEAFNDVLNETDRCDKPVREALQRSHC